MNLNCFNFGKACEFSMFFTELDRALTSQRLQASGKLQTILGAKAISFSKNVLPICGDEESLYSSHSHQTLPISSDLIYSFYFMTVFVEPNGSKT